MQQLPGPPFGETAMSTIETQQANGGSLATSLPAIQSGRRARRHASWQRISLATDVVTLALALFLDHLTSAAMPVAWTFVFAALVIGLLATKGMYRPTLDLWKLDAIRSIVSAVAIAAALTIALRALYTDASAIAEETLEPWLLSTAFLIASRVWLSLPTPRQKKGGSRSARPDRRRRQRRAVSCEEAPRAPGGGIDTDWVPRQGAAVRRRGNRPSRPRRKLGSRPHRPDKQIDHVIVTFSTAPEEVHLRLLKRCDQIGIATSLVPRLYESRPSTSPSSRSAGFR